MTHITAVEQLNSARYLYLRQLSEPHDNSLKLAVEEAVLNSSGLVRPSEMPELDAILKGASPIESVEGCKVFELYWKHYVAYLVTEELVGSNAKDGYDDECFTGKLLRSYSKSHFLAHVARDTGGHIEPIQHYKLVCLNHLIPRGSGTRFGVGPARPDTVLSEKIPIFTQWHQPLDLPLPRTVTPFPSSIPPADTSCRARQCRRSTA